MSKVRLITLFVLGLYGFSVLGRPPHSRGDVFQNNAFDSNQQALNNLLIANPGLLNGGGFGGGGFGGGGFGGGGFGGGGNNQDVAKQIEETKKSTIDKINKEKDDFSKKLQESSEGLTKAYERVLNGQGKENTQDLLKEIGESQKSVDNKGSFESMDSTVGAVVEDIVATTKLKKDELQERASSYLPKLPQVNADTPEPESKLADKISRSTQSGLDQALNTESSLPRFPGVRDPIRNPSSTETLDVFQGGATNPSVGGGYNVPSEFGPKEKSHSHSH